jgi:hypothetical protein
VHTVLAEPRLEFERLVDRHPSGRATPNTAVLVAQELRDAAGLVVDGPTRATFTYVAGASSSARPWPVAGASRITMS